MNKLHPPAPRWRLINADDFHSLPDHGVSAGRTTRRSVSMPAVQTDLEEIFEADSVCMVRRVDPKDKAIPNSLSVSCSEEPPPASGISDPRLIEVLRQWPSLPEDIQSGLIAVVESVSKNG
jgi:hypothetical protein